MYLYIKSVIYKYIYKIISDIILAFKEFIIKLKRQTDHT